MNLKIRGVRRSPVTTRILPAFLEYLIFERACVAMETEIDNEQYVNDKEYVDNKEHGDNKEYVDNKEYNVWESSNTEEEVDQFQLLEEKVDALIERTVALKEENVALEEKLSIEAEKVVDLNTQVEALRSGRNDAKQKIISLLEKMEQVPG